MTLRVAGIEYEHREVLLKDKPAELVRVSPKATVPVLILNNSEQTQVLEESIDICLLYTSPSPRDQRGSRMPSSA